MTNTTNKVETYKEEKIDSYFTITFRFKNSRRGVQSAEHFDTQEAAIEKASKLANNDCLHVYDVHKVEVFDIYTNGHFFGCTDRKSPVARFFDGEKIW